MIAPIPNEENPMDETGEIQNEKNTALWLLSLLEDYALQNIRLKAFILSLPMAQHPDFSLDALLKETEQSAGIERDLRERHGEARKHILAASDYQRKLKQLLPKLEG
jgi:hypothetical protein